MPGTHAPQNMARAHRAQQAITAYVKSRGDDIAPDDERPSQVSDVLADLMHLCVVHGIDFDAALESAHLFHTEELENPDE